LDIRGRPLLRRLVDTMRNGGIRDIRVVRGYKKEAIDFPDIDVVDNDRFMDTGEAWSLACAELPTSGALTIAYGDILFSPSVVEQMNASDQDVTLVVDADYARNPTHGDGRQVDLVGVSRPHGVDFLVDENEAPALVTALGDAASDAENKGEWIGLVRLSEAGVVALRAAIETMRADGTLERARLPDLLGILMARGISMRALYISGGWLDVDDAFDLAAARNFV
jgi:phosphoenolpyruvate phosphomutase